jgi:hypothetical protein
MATDEELPDAEESAQVKNQIEEITAYADNLLAQGNNNIYSSTREKLIMLYQEETDERFREDPAAVKDAPMEEAKWEYKWPGDDQVHSAFISDDMRSWKAGGFFGQGVICRPAGSLDPWKSSEEITF